MALPLVKRKRENAKSLAMEYVKRTSDISLQSFKSLSKAKDIIFPYMDYPISVQLTDTNGCNTQNTLTNYMFVDGYPSAGFRTSVDTLDVVCYPTSINFTDTSIFNLGDVIGFSVDPTSNHGNVNFVITLEYETY